MITEAERQFCMYKLGMEGSFFTSLIETMFRADIGNLALLSRAYPDLTEVVRRFRNEVGYWEQLCRDWNSVNPHHQILV